MYKNTQPVIQVTYFVYVLSFEKALLEIKHVLRLRTKLGLARTIVSYVTRMKVQKCHHET